MVTILLVRSGNTDAGKLTCAHFCFNWTEQVSEQEAVDVFSSDRNSLESCRKLVDISSSRGNRDDITVMKIDLHNFK